MSYDKVHKGINDYFFGGQARPEWITDILSGRKTPFKSVANDLWRKQYNRQAVIQQAQSLAHQSELGPIGKVVTKMRYIPRSVAVFGHGIVFPVTHAGDLLLRPQSWSTFIKGAARTYRAAGSSAYSARTLHNLALDPMYDLALRSGVDVGPKSHPVGLISEGGKKTGYLNAAARAWDMLTVMRFELWKKQVNKFAKAGMSEAEMLDIGKNLADWANHATGSGKGGVANLGGGTLFGPKLTQSKLNRITIDPYKTAKTIANWKTATAGEKAAAWTRISGATQYLAATVGFLAVNQGLLSAFGSDEKINFANPDSPDWLSFKGDHLHAYVPGLHTEVRTLAKILNIAYKERKELRGDTKFAATAKTLGQYGMGKLEPGIQRGAEVLFGQDWQGRPLPWSKDEGTEKKPKMTTGEYLGQVGPIPLEGPIGYVYDTLKENGASSMDASQIVKGMIIFGGGLPGFHVTETHEKR